MNQGWECPKCGKVYAPQVQQCFTCGKNNYQPISYPIYPQPMYPYIHYYVPTVYSGTTWTSTKFIVNNNPDDPDSGVGAKV